MTYFLYSYFKINFVLCSSSSFSLLYDIPHAIPQNAILKCTLLSTVCGHLDDFQFSASTNNKSMNILVPVSLCICVMIFLRRYAEVWNLRNRFSSTSLEIDSLLDRPNDP